MGRPWVVAEAMSARGRGGAIRLVDAGEVGKAGGGKGRGWGVDDGGM